MKHAFPAGQGGGRYRPLRANGYTEKCTRCGLVRRWALPAGRWIYGVGVKSPGTCEGFPEDAQRDVKPSKPVQSFGDALHKLHEALRWADNAKAAVRDNRGHDKVLAREGFEQQIADEVIPAVIAALEVAPGEIAADQLYRLADAVSTRLTRGTP